MKAIRIRKRIKSDTLKLPQLKKLVGKDVELLIVATEIAKNGRLADRRFPLRGTEYSFDDPFSPAVPAKDWDANK
ncbi:MAG: hypothetical protein IT462_03875 [Planctomycetes bacterium]|nr:hypothetical protein [Planctomycetota bacterium]